MNYLLDPYIVQMPEPFDTNAQLEDYLQSLGVWSKLAVNSSEDQFWFSEPAMVALCEARQYPRYSKFKEISERLADEDLAFDPTTAARFCEKFNNSQLIDDEIVAQCPEVEQYLFEEQNTALLPAEISRRLRPNVAQALIQTFTRLALMHKHCENSVLNDLFFATRTLAAQHDQLEFKSRCQHAESGLFHDLEKNWIFVADPADLWDNTQMEKNWRDTRWGVRWAYDNLVKHKVLDPHKFKLPPETAWCAGAHFNKSIEEHHFDKANDLIAIFQSVVKVLVQYWPRETMTHENHFLQRDNHQITRPRDGACAWRAWVTKYVPKLRLHYWLHQNRIELSIVVPHQNYTIR